MERGVWREGYWRNSADDAGLPWPVPNRSFDATALLKSLARVEAEADRISYRGWSNCRLCGKPNGSQEFTEGVWRWPSGLRHYIEEHHVKPSDEFIAFIFARDGVNGFLAEGRAQSFGAVEAALAAAAREHFPDSDFAKGVVPGDYDDFGT